MIKKLINEIKIFFCGHNHTVIMHCIDTQYTIIYCKICDKYRLRHDGIGCQTDMYKYEEFKRILSREQIEFLEKCREELKEEKDNDSSKN